MAVSIHQRQLFEQSKVSLDLPFARAQVATCSYVVVTISRLCHLPVELHAAVGNFSFQTKSLQVS